FISDLRFSQSVQENLKYSRQNDFKIPDISSDSEVSLEPEADVPRINY
ncbi:1127_t:CDS:2, partial [Diversispora eburnea]